MSEKFDWSILAPGEEVAIPNSDLKVRVFPMGVRHLAKFQAEVSMLLGKIAGMKIDPAATSATIFAGMGAELIPFICGPGLSLLDECCDPSIRGAPHWVLPIVAESWARQSFGADVLKNYGAAASAISRKLTGSPLSASARDSRDSSRPDTTPETSSTGDTTDSTGRQSSIQDGPGPSSSSGAMQLKSGTGG